MAAGAVDCYRLSVAAGDAVRLRVLSGTGNSLGANVEVIDPGGKSVCADSIGGSALDCTAGPAGTYTRSWSATTTTSSAGSYRVWAQRLNDPARLRGTARTPRLATMAAGAVDCYRLSVAAGDAVRLRLLSGTGNSLGANVEMIHPGGKSVCADSIGGGARWTAPPGQQAPTRSWSATTTTSSAGLTGSGRKAQRSGRLRGTVLHRACLATMAAGAVDCYRLSVAAGDVVRLRVLSRDSATRSAPTWK